MGYDFDTILDRKGTSSLKWDFDERFEGLSGLLPLWVADMDFAAPKEILDAVRRRVEHGVFGYTLEPASYFEAGAEWLHRRHGWTVQRDWLLASPGVIPCLAAAILSLTEPGDGIVIQPPVYYPFALRIRGNGRRVVENPLVQRGARWEMDLEGLERAGDARTRMLVLCSPHNPVGRVWTRKELEGLAAVCARRGIVIVSDEIHCDLVMKGFRHVPVGSLPAAEANSVTLFSATKTFNLAGMGGSLAVIPDAGLRKKVDAVQHALFSGVANAAAVVACEAAWRQGEKWLKELLDYVEQNYRFLAGFLSERLPQVRISPLEGTYLAWLDMRGLGLGDPEIKRRLLHNAGVWLDAGSIFGLQGEGFQRVNLACPRAILSDALERMARTLSPEGGRETPAGAPISL